MESNTDPVHTKPFTIVHDGIHHSTYKQLTSTMMEFITDPVHIKQFTSILMEFITDPAHTKQFTSTLMESIKDPLVHILTKLPNAIIILTSPSILS